MLTSLQFSDSYTVLGVELDQALSVDRHVSSIVSSCNFHIHAPCHIRLTSHTRCCQICAVSIVGACLDYCNSLLYGTSQHNPDHLQRVRNSLARAVTQAPRRSSATELRRQLHWLPIRQRVGFELGTISLHSGPSTLVHWLTLRVRYIGINHPGHCALTLLPPCTGLMPPLTSINTHLQSPRSPATWNNIPASIRDSGTLAIFKTAFKTRLFNSACKHVTPLTVIHQRFRFTHHSTVPYGAN